MNRIHKLYSLIPWFLLLLICTLFMAEVVRIFLLCHSWFQSGCQLLNNNAHTFVENKHPELFFWIVCSFIHCQLIEKLFILFLLRCLGNFILTASCYFKLASIIRRLSVNQLLGLVITVKPCWLPEVLYTWTQIWKRTKRHSFCF